MDEKIKIELTGNPFVDTGMAVISSLAGLEDVNQLTLAGLKSVYGDGAQLTEWNSKLKAFTQIFGTNNPLSQTAYGFKKGKGPSDTNRRIYQSTLGGLLSEIGKLGDGPRCWACGNRSNFDFAEVCRSAVEVNGKRAPKDKWVGRDWFPLAGSLGSDAQALPAASKPPHICPRCLLAVHYLPMGLMLLDGKLGVFQSTSIEFWYELIINIVAEVKGRVQSGNYETLGKRERHAVLRRLLKFFESPQRRKLIFELSNETSLYVWRFSNSGPSPECSVEEIPNPAITFLQNVVNEGLRFDIDSLVNSEGKNPRYSLFQCILDKRDYSNLYPRRRAKGASMKLFALYQTRIRDHSTKALQIAHRLAQEASKLTSVKEFKRLQRHEAFKEETVRNRFRAIMVQMAEEGKFKLEDYLDLFPINEGQGVTVGWDGWNLIGFYLHHVDEDFPMMEEKYAQIKVPLRLSYYAGQIYNHYLSERGKDRFQKEVLAQMDRRIHTSWLRNQFAQLAESEVGFTYGNWSKLCKLENERLFVSELLFQMRLLWIQWFNEDRRSVNISISNGEESTDGLPEHVRRLIEALFTDYINRRGLDRSYRDILLRLRRREIGLPWFKEKLTKHSFNGIQPLVEEEWDEFLSDIEGYGIRSERLFQFHLAAANLLRIKT